MAPQAYPGSEELLLWNWLWGCVHTQLFLLTFPIAQADARAVGTSCAGIVVYGDTSISTTERSETTSAVSHL